LKQPLLPRTNNDLELFIGNIKKSKSVHTGLVQSTSPKNGTEWGLSGSRVPMSCGSI
jgi:hypothetical protein